MYITNVWNVAPTTTYICLMMLSDRDTDILFYKLSEIFQVNM